MLIKRLDYVLDDAEDQVRVDLAQEYKLKPANVYPCTSMQRAQDLQRKHSQHWRPLSTFRM
jgi:hypothetical protein